MQTIELDQLRYPTGKFKMPGEFSKKSVDEWIQTINELPEKLKVAVTGLDNDQLDTPYREGGWTVRQVVHHLADSHLNSYIRFKLAITEEVPVIKPYLEKKWAELEDAKNSPVELSLTLLESLHKRWIIFLLSLNEESLKRKFLHPESKREWQLYEVVALYAWHCNHHLAHITSLKEREGWK